MLGMAIESALLMHGCSLVGKTSTFPSSQKYAEFVLPHVPDWYIQVWQLSEKKAELKLPIPNRELLTTLAQWPDYHLIIDLSCPIHIDRTIGLWLEGITGYVRQVRQALERHDRWLAHPGVLALEQHYDRVQLTLVVDADHVDSWLPAGASTSSAWGVGEKVRLWDGSKGILIHHTPLTQTVHVVLGENADWVCMTAYEHELASREDASLAERIVRLQGILMHMEERARSTMRVGMVTGFIPVIGMHIRNLKRERAYHERSA